MTEAPDTTPVLLLDGPLAGRIIHAPLGVTAWTTPIDELTSYGWLLWELTAAYTTPGTPGTAETQITVGYSDGPHPGRTALAAHLPATFTQLANLPDGAALAEVPALVPDKPIAVADPGAGPAEDCATRAEQMRDATGSYGQCTCGWRTETVPRRRADEVWEMAFRHGTDAIKALLSRQRRERPHG